MPQPLAVLFNAANAIDLTIPVRAGEGDAFGLEPPSYTALLPAEAGCQAHRIAFCAHSSGTHTECAAHVTKQGDFEPIFAQHPLLSTCLVVQVVPERLKEAFQETYLNSNPAPGAEELVVSKQCLQRVMQAFSATRREAPSIYVQIVGCAPSDWVFFTDQAMDYLVREFCVINLLVNKVSIDRERCGVGMPAHRHLFCTPSTNGDGLPRRTLTENVKTDASLADGYYLLSLQLAPFLGTDAVPSRVVLFPLL